MQYHTILFDLDGTLTDPKEGITKSVAYALQHFGIQVENLDSLTCYIGPPLAVSFPEYHGISEEDTPTAVAKYRERFSDVGWAENLVYDGIEQMLAAQTTLQRMLRHCVQCSFEDVNRKNERYETYSPAAMTLRRRVELEVKNETPA